jgi:hypothetical protein
LNYLEAKKKKKRKRKRKRKRKKKKRETAAYIQLEERNKDIREIF